MVLLDNYLMSEDNPLDLTTDVYKAALDKAFDEWTNLQNQEREITVRKNQLRQTFLALYPLVYPEPGGADISSMTLANAIRTVIGGSHRPITAIEMRGRLTDLGYDLAKYENPMASIHTAMNRMVESEEMIYVEEDNKKKFSPGPELKPVPTAEPTQSNDQLRNSILALLNAGEEKK